MRVLHFEQEYNRSQFSRLYIVYILTLLFEYCLIVTYAIKCYGFESRNSLDKSVLHLLCKDSILIDELMLHK
jgi:hypothetical protein